MYKNPTYASTAVARNLWLRQLVHGWVLFLDIKSVYDDYNLNNKYKRNDRGKRLGWPVTTYGPGTCFLGLVSLRLVNSDLTGIGWMHEIYISVGVNKFKSGNSSKFLWSLIRRGSIQNFHNDSETQETGLLGVKESKAFAEKQSLHLRRLMFRTSQCWF